MLGSNWKALIASKAIQVGVGKKRKIDEDGVEYAAAGNNASAASSGAATVTPCLAIDCEFVGTGPEGLENALARVSIVNFHGLTVYDKYVKPTDPVTDFRTAVSGIRPQHIHSKTAVTFKQCQKEVSELIQGKILVGHAVHNDLTVLLLSHPKSLLRDTSRYKGLCPDRPRSLKKLVAEVLHQQIQLGEHNSVEDAKATLALYKHVRAKWEKELFDKQHKRIHSGTDTPSTAATTAAASSSSTLSASSSSSTTVTLTHRKKVDLIAVKQEQKKVANVERNQRRKKMRTEQKNEKQNW